MAAALALSVEGCKTKTQPDAPAAIESVAETVQPTPTSSTTAADPVATAALLTIPTATGVASAGVKPNSTAPSQAAAQQAELLAALGQKSPAASATGLEGLSRMNMPTLSGYGAPPYNQDGLNGASLIPTPTVAVATTSQVGGDARVIARARPRYRLCAVRESQNNPSAEGKWTGQAIVNVKGEVTAVHGTTSGLAGNETACIEAVTRTLNFDEGTAHQVPITLTHIAGK